MRARQGQKKKGNHTLSVHEVINQDIVSSLLLQGSVVEQLLVDIAAQTRILLAESTDVAIDSSSVLDKTRIPPVSNPPNQTYTPNPE